MKEGDRWPSEWKGRCAEVPRREAGGCVPYVVTRAAVIAHRALIPFPRNPFWERQLEVPSQNAKEGREMGIIGWILLGLLAGAIAKLILPGDDPGGFIVTTLIGIAGAIVGGLIASALDIGDLQDGHHQFPRLSRRRSVGGKDRRREDERKEECEVAQGGLAHTPFLTSLSMVTF